MKIWYCFFPLFIYLLVILLCCFIRSSPKLTDDPEVIKGKNNLLFLYRDGTAIDFHKIEKIIISNPWPNHYDIVAKIGWDSYVLKGGFSKNEDADEWIKSFLKDIYLSENDKKARETMGEMGKLAL